MWASSMISDHVITPVPCTRPMTILCSSKFSGYFWTFHFASVIQLILFIPTRRSITSSFHGTIFGDGIWMLCIYWLLSLRLPFIFLGSENILLRRRNWLEVFEKVECFTEISWPLHGFPFIYISTHGSTIVQEAISKHWDAMQDHLEFLLYHCGQFKLIILFIFSYLLLHLECIK